LAVWPATGKTIIARELTRRLAASYLRIDTIEQRLREAGLAVGASGYVVANALAAENLLIGRTVMRTASTRSPRAAMAGVKQPIDAPRVIEI
jgi:predicted kinase